MLKMVNTVRSVLLCAFSLFTCFSSKVNYRPFLNLMDMQYFFEFWKHFHKYINDNWIKL